MFSFQINMFKKCCFFINFSIVEFSPTTVRLSSNYINDETTTIIRISSVIKLALRITTITTSKKQYF